MEDAADDKNFYLERVGGGQQLKRNHVYYYQVTISRSSYPVSALLYKKNVL